MLTHHLPFPWDRRNIGIVASLIESNDTGEGGERRVKSVVDGALVDLAMEVEIVLVSAATVALVLVLLVAVSVGVVSPLGEISIVSSNVSAGWWRMGGLINVATVPISKIGLGVPVSAFGMSGNSPATVGAREIRLGAPPVSVSEAGI